jgi:hypothetical protein
MATYPESYRAPWRDRLPGPLRALAGNWWQLAAALVVAILLAQQVIAPNSRMIKLVAGVVLFMVAYRTRPFYALCFIAIMFPFPFSIFVGSSTMIFVVLLLIVYLARMTLNQVPPLQRTPYDALVGLFFALHVISFFNIENAEILRGAVLNMFTITSALILYFLTANLIRTEEQLRTFAKVLGITLTLCVFVAFYELLIPNRPLIPHWILDRRGVFEGAAGYRVSGPFYDYELFGEFMAMGFFLSFFLYRRAGSVNARFFYGALSLLTMFTLLLTVTRGATLAWLGGVAYLFWLLRRKLKPRDVMMTLLIAISAYLLMENVVVNFTRSASVLDRLVKTTFVGGVPDSRQHWPEVLERILNHPFIGHGPYYDLGLNRGITGGGLYTYAWPHSQYLYFAHTIGFIGLGVFVLIALKFLISTYRRKVDSLQDPDFTRGLITVLHIMLLVFFIDQLKIEYVRNPTYHYFPWMLMGLTAAAMRIHGERKKPG